MKLTYLVIMSFSMWNNLDKNIVSATFVNCSKNQFQKTWR